MNAKLVNALNSQKNQKTKKTYKIDGTAAMTMAVDLWPAYVCSYTYVHLPVCTHTHAYTHARESHKDTLTMHVQLSVLLGFSSCIGSHTCVSASIFQKSLGNLENSTRRLYLIGNRKHGSIWVGFKNIC